MRAWFPRSLTVFALIVMVGCTSKVTGPDKAKPFPVQGRIVLSNGTPLRGGVIYFSPVEEENNSGDIRFDAASLVDANGHYKLGFNGDGKGAAAGEYKVTITPRETSELPRSNSESIPEKYREKSSTPLTVMVAETDNTFDFTLH
jgi:hypothetical protein